MQKAHAHFLRSYSDSKQESGNWYRKKLYGVETRWNYDRKSECKILDGLPWQYPRDFERYYETNIFKSLLLLQYQIE